MIKQKYLFALITLFYLASRWFIFLGFNGTDDLHYAMLSSRILTGTFDPFVPNDIYCGRIALLTFQAIIYQLGGISVLTTQIGTVLATIFSCYLTIFKIIKPKNWLHVLLACSLFYFNPLLLYATLGILPDAYIMLLGIYFVLLTKNLLSENTNNRPLQKSLWLGALIGLSLLIKEIAILFLFFCTILILIYKPRQYFAKIAMIVVGFVLIVSVTGIYYYLHTGNFFFRIAQINNSDYQNTLYRGIGLKSWLIRLTYGPWQIFIVHGFYPLVIAGFVLALQLLTKGWLYVKNNYYLFSFLLLLLLTLYFPFSLQEFRPLGIDSRHFLFLLPLAVVICSEYLYSGFVQSQKTRILFLCILIICIFSTQNKWQWMIYGLISILFFIGPLLRLYSRAPIFILCSILWLSLFETVFFKGYPWFKEMELMSKNIPGNCFYFIDNDNMMHWELLHKFDTIGNSYYDLEKKPFFMFSPYYSKINTDSFKPGWLIVNNVYSQPAVRFQNTLQLLKKTNAFAKQLAYKHIEALYIADSTTLQQLIASGD
jgi:hypothetical protein